MNYWKEILITLFGHFFKVDDIGFWSSWGLGLWKTSADIDKEDQEKIDQ